MRAFLKTILQHALSRFNYVYHAPLSKDDRVIYFTFDDGPHEKYTQSILDVLAKHGAKATFFLVGKSLIQSGTTLLQNILSEGHGVGNHTFSHKNLSQCSYKDIKSEIVQMDEQLSPYVNSTPAIRPPYGKLGFRYLLFAMINRRKTILWSKDYKDFAADTVDEVIEKIDYATIRSGDIILMHDASQISVDVLGVMLKTLGEKGYSFMPLPDAASALPQIKGVRLD